MEDAIDYRCPFCGKELKIPGKFAGVKGACKGCNHSITAPISNARSDGSFVHYTLIHRSLVFVYSNHPEMLVDDLNNMEEPNKTALGFVWVAGVGEMMKRGTFPPFKFADIQQSKVRVADRDALLIRMPTPVKMAEAYFVCAFLDDSSGGDSDEPRVHFYTLELSFDQEGTQLTYLCAWDNGSHVNYGEGPPADPDAFLEAVAAKLSGGDEDEVE